MAAAAAAAAVAAASIASTAYSASQSGKGTKSKSTNAPTPQQQAIQTYGSRLLMARYAQGPQTFGQYRQEGPRPYPQPLMNTQEAQALGYIPWQQHGFRTPTGERIEPRYWDPATINMIQQGDTPGGLLNALYNPNSRNPFSGTYGGRGDLGFITGENAHPQGQPYPQAGLDWLSSQMQMQGQGGGMGANDPFLALLRAQQLPQNPGRKVY